MIAGFAVAFFYLFLYFIFGSLLTARMKTEHFSVTLTCIIGFFFYYLVFTVVGLPMKLTLQPLSRLSVVWFLVIAAVVIASCIINKKVWLKRIMAGVPRRTLWVYLAIFFLIAVQLFIIHRNAGIGSPFDAGYYIGEVNSSVYTNKISQYDPYTGYQFKELHGEYMLVTYQMHSMVMCQVLQLAPLIEMKTGMTTVVIFLFNMILYQTVVHVCKKVDIYTVGALFLMNLIMLLDDSIFTQTGFYYYRTFEGKTALAVLVVPAMLLLFIRVVRDCDNTWNWIYLLLMSFTSFIFAMSGMLLVPVFLFTALFSFALSRRSMKIFLKMVGVLVPCVILIGCYLLISKGLFTVSIPS